jgi:hypothetical protein
MSWLFSQVLVEEYLGDTSLDGAPCALWNGMPTQRASWLPDKMTDACLLSRSGMTFKLLTDDRGEAVLMSYLEDFPVRTFPAQEKERESKENEAPCGSTWRESSAKYQPRFALRGKLTNACGKRTCNVVIADLTEMGYDAEVGCCGSAPRRGSSQAGQNLDCGELPRLANWE